ncbi:MAG: hypothetical protein IPM33_13195 [Phycisphaerales bacterium]|nr:hypothetical protein [Phycisphaerales bacterium]
MTNAYHVVGFAGGLMMAGALALGQATPEATTPAPVVIQPGWQPGPNAGRGGMSGIGGTRANIDLISSPVRNRPIVVPAPTVTIFPRPPVVYPPGYCPPAPCPPRPCPPQPCPPHAHPTPIVITTGSGLSVGGTYSSGNWRVGFQLGQPIQAVTPVVCAPTPTCSDALYGWRHYGWGGPYVWTTRYSGVNVGTSPFVGSTGTYIDPSLQTMPVSAPAAEPSMARELTLTERAAYATYEGKALDAVRLLREHLRDEPSDTRALRLLSLALLDARDYEDAAAVMGLAYRTDPGLANEAIAFGSAGLSEGRMRELLTRAVGFAHKVNSASAWLMVGAIMQAEGRENLARTMIERARKAGLEPAVYDALVAELR